MSTLTSFCKLALMNKEELLKNILYMYGNCGSYRDVCRLELERHRLRDQWYNVSIEYQTWFKRPHSFRVESALIYTTEKGSDSTDPARPERKLLFAIAGNEDQADLLTYETTAPPNSTVTGARRERFSSIDLALEKKPDIPLTVKLLRSAFLTDVRSITEFPATQVSDRTCNHLAIFYGKNMTEAHIWTDSRSNVIRKMTQSRGPLRDGTMRFASKVFGGVSSMFRSGMEIEILEQTTYVYDEIELNPEIKPEMFVCR